MLSWVRSVEYHTKLHKLKHMLKLKQLQTNQDKMLLK